MQLPGSVKQRVAVSVLSVSMVAFTGWKASEGYTDGAVIPTKGDVPTIGHGSTHYEDGTPVRLGDKITPERADVLALNLLEQDAKRLAASMPGAELNQQEFDQYLDFSGQFGFSNWMKSGMRRNVMAGRYAAACASLLNWRYAAGYDCSTLVNGRPNKRCYGVWTRQLKRYDACMAAQQGQPRGAAKTGENKTNKDLQ